MPKNDNRSAALAATPIVLRSELSALRELVRCAQHHFDRNAPQVYRWLDEAERILGQQAHEGGGELRLDPLDAHSLLTERPEGPRS